MSYIYDVTYVFYLFHNLCFVINSLGLLVTYTYDIKINFWIDDFTSFKERVIIYKGVSICSKGIEMWSMKLFILNRSV